MNLDTIEATIKVIVGNETLLIPASLTREEVENRIRTRKVMIGGGLELNGIMVGPNHLVGNSTYEFKGGIPAGSF